MKLSIERRDLLALATRAANVVNSRNTIPILANVKLSARDGQLCAVSTTLDQQLETRVPARVDVEGEITVDAKLLADIAKAIKDGALIECDLSDYMLHLSAGRAKYKLQTLPVEDFPMMRADNFTTTFEVDATALRNMLEKTVWASSADEARYYLQGVAMQHRDGKAVFIATDGHRLARFIGPDLPAFPDVIIPSKAVAEFMRILDGETAEVSVSETKVRVVIGDTSITSKLIDGTYPDWTQVIPAPRPDYVTASSVDLKDAITRVVIVASDRVRAVKLSVAGGSLGIDVRDQNGHTAEERIDVEQVGADVVIGINSKYGLDALNRADKGDVTIQYGGSGEPMLVQYAEEPNLVAVIMPVRV